MVVFHKLCRMARSSRVHIIASVSAMGKMQHVPQGPVADPELS